jgi:hypothetical protein
VRTRFSRDSSAREARKLDSMSRKGDVCDLRVQRSEQERLEQRWLPRMHVQLWRRGALTDLNEPGGCKRGKEVIAQSADIADRRGRDVVLERRAVRNVYRLDYGKLCLAKEMKGEKGVPLNRKRAWRCATLLDVSACIRRMRGCW